MLYVLIGEDAPNALDKRLAARGEHGEAPLDLVGQRHGRVFRKGLTVQRVNTPVVM